MTSEDKCFICATTNDDKILSTDRLASSLPFRDPVFPGHTVVAPESHVELEDVSGEEWQAIGEMLRRTSRAIRGSNAEIEKVYLVAIGDVDRGHLHFHLLPKHRNGPGLGPYVFGGDGWVSGGAQTDP